MAEIFQFLEACAAGDISKVKELFWIIPMWDIRVKGYQVACLNNKIAVVKYLYSDDRAKCDDNYGIRIATKYNFTELLEFLSKRR
jgi:hypothetical protein